MSAARMPQRIRSGWSRLALSITGVLAVALGSPWLAAAPPQTRTARNLEPSYLTPVELKFSPDGARLYVVCEGSDALLAVDARARRVIGRVRVGHKPRDVAVSPDGKTLYVSNEWSDTVSEIDAASLKIRRTLQTGWGPIGLTTDRTGAILYVANSIGDDVSLIDLRRGVEIKRLAAWRSPHYVALSRDARRVYVSNLLPHLGPYDQPPVSELTVIDTAKQAVAARVLIPGVIELRHIAEAPGKPASYLLVPFLRPKNLNPLIQVAQGWFLTHGMAVVRLPAGAAFPETHPQVTQVLLDDLDSYYAGPNGAVFTPDGRYAFVTSSEANVVSVIDTTRLERFLRRKKDADLSNRLDSAAEFVVRRLRTGLNPAAVAVSPDGQSAFIANRLDDTLTVVNVRRLEVQSVLRLGGPKEISALRRGEQLFHDAHFCFQGQFACGTCHPDDHLDGVAWNLETPQLGRDRVANRTLRGIAETAPYKWNGHNPDIETQCGPRTAKFLFHSEGFDAGQLKDLVAFVKSIPLPPNRHLAADGQLTPAQERGKAVFFRKKCETCHPPATHYTAKYGTDVGSATKFDTAGLFDIPQLDRVYQTAPYLHNGEALTLEEIWTLYNLEDKHGVTSDMTKEQLNDLIEYLKTL
ncbi:MAG: beta-propeller fold lactonase family protein [Acidobacteriia bacterium]|nr:beta-propeller fold lactonase family protein [Terriglobia bacterium]